MSDRQTIAGGDQGVLNFNGGNEFEFDAITAVHEDAMMIRRGSTVTVNGGGGGADSWDNIPNGPSGRRVQMVLLHGEQSEMVRGQPGNPQGSIKLQLNDGNGEADGNMKTAFQLEARSGVSARDGSAIEAFTLGEPQWESLVRQLSARMDSPIRMGFANKLVSPDGIMELDVQNHDAKGLVLYDNSRVEGDRAVWSARLDKP